MITYLAITQNVYFFFFLQHLDTKNKKELYLMRELFLIHFSNNVNLPLYYHLTSLFLLTFVNKNLELKVKFRNS